MPEDIGYIPEAIQRDNIFHISKHGHTEIVRLLLEDPRVDPSDGGNDVLQMVSENCYLQVVRLLLAACPSILFKL